MKQLARLLVLTVTIVAWRCHAFSFEDLVLTRTSQGQTVSPESAQVT